jgi:hypothetical protein
VAVCSRLTATSATYPRVAVCTSPTRRRSGSRAKPSSQARAGSTWMAWMATACGTFITPAAPKVVSPSVAPSLAGPVPCWIIQPPTPWATSRTSSPARIATAMLGEARMAVKASTVRATITATSTAIAAAPPRNSA